MLPKIREAKYQGDYRVWLLFVDGVSGEIDLEKELWGEIFEPLKDKNKFSKIKFDHDLGTIIWPNGADFSPEFLYQQLCPEYKLKAASKINSA